jgi:hypothetical protein
MRVSVPAATDMPSRFTSLIAGELLEALSIRRGRS